MGDRIQYSKEVEVLYKVDVLVVGCGEVAGRAASRAAQENVLPRDIDVLELRK